MCKVLRVNVLNVVSLLFFFVFLRASFCFVFVFCVVYRVSVRVCVLFILFLFCADNKRRRDATKWQSFAPQQLPVAHTPRSRRTHTRTRAEDAHTRIGTVCV